MDHKPKIHDSDSKHFYFRKFPKEMKHRTKEYKFPTKHILGISSHLCSEHLIPSL